MTYGTVNVDAMTTSDSITSSGVYGFKNRIINGQMQIDQRNSGASVTPSTNSYYLDRWAVTMGAASKYSLQQVTDAPTGFYNSIKMTTTTAYATATYFDLYQRIEGYNWNDMNWGTASAKPVTVSFWVKSSVTGSYTGFIRSNDQALDVPFSYTINSANTWEYKTSTVAGATTGNWGGTTGVGAALFFDFPNIIPTLGATWQITGVQLEKGSTATSFDYRPYGTELALCQRYYQQISKGNSTTALLGTATYFSASRADGITFLPVSMRTTPSFSVVTGASYYRVYLAGNSYNCTTVTFNEASSDFSKVLYYNNTDFSGMTNGSGWWEGSNVNSFIGLTAEL